MTRRRPKSVRDRQRAADAEWICRHYASERVEVLLDADTRQRMILTVEAMARFDAGRGEPGRTLKGEQALFQTEYDAAYAAGIAQKKAG